MQEFINWIYEDWYVIFVLLVCVFMIYITLSDKKKVIEWLKYAVTIAESNLGGGTGQIKLRQVYDMFIEKFPIFSKIVPFKIFSSWVDYALEFLRTQLETNNKIKELVENTPIIK